MGGVRMIDAALYACRCPRAGLRPILGDSHGASHHLADMRPSQHRVPRPNRIAKPISSLLQLPLIPGSPQGKNGLTGEIDMGI